MKTFKLNNGIEIPQIGLGVYKSQEGEQAVQAVKWALEEGYRHIDTAKIYRNEESVGKGWKESGVPREEIFLTTKLWNEDVVQEKTKEVFEESLRKLQTDYVDLYLIHWPVRKWKQAYLEMEELYNQGKIKAIGLSNFTKANIEEIERDCHVMPAVNQIESNPYFNNQELIDYCLSKGIQVEVWSPLGGSKTTKIRDDEVLNELAKKYNVSVAQIIIRWHVQRGVIVLPKSVHKDRIIENMDVYNFELSAEDMEIINGLNRNERTGPDPEVYPLDF